MAWSDRQYPQDDRGPLFGSPQKTGTFWLIAITFAVQVVIWLFGGGQSGVGTSVVSDWFALTWEHLLSFQIWRYVTYMFLHGDVMHVLLNMMVLYFMGRMLEPHFGRKTFITLYLVFGAIAALGHPIYSLLLTDPPYRGVIGASGATMALVALFGARFPRAQVVFFFIPMTGAGMAALIVGIDIIQVIASQGNSGTAHGVHLAGAAAGLVYGLYGNKMDIFVQTMKHKRQRKIEVADATRKQADKLELDRILEKISAQGMGELTDKERDFLKRTSERLKSKS